MPRGIRDESEANSIFAAPLQQRGSRMLTNQELAQSNQRLQARIQRLSMAYQTAEQQNFMLRDRCLRLQNRVEELKAHLCAIKTDVGQRVPPLRLIAGHLYEVASFLESLDRSIEIGSGQDLQSSAQTGLSAVSCSVPEKQDANKKAALETISESAEGMTIS